MSPVTNIATMLTWLRIAAIPLIVIVFYLPVGWAHPAAAVVFIMAAITDGLDGYLARRLELTSDFGAFLDPVADKLMVVTALILILQADPRVFIAAITAIIIGREVMVSALREWMAEMGNRGEVAVTGVAKKKTIAQMFGLSLMLWTQDLFGIPIYEIGIILMLIAAGLTLWSMVIYVRAAWPYMAGKQELP
jgi:CDP-diacylglycerol--glycerol-3-phosphate 3-phosphatidyltransferase/cardiolipin synthase